MKNYSFGLFGLLIVVAFVTLASCDIISSGSDDKGFRSEPGPILYVGSENEPFTQFHKKQLYSINEDGSRMRQLTDYEDYEVIDAAWSPNGDNIVMIKNQLNSMSRWGQNLHMVNHRGNNDRRLITDKNDKWGIKSVSTPVWSPDSRKIAFVGVTNVNDQGSGGANDVYVINVQSGEIQKITNTPSVVESLGSWSGKGHIYATEIYRGTSPTKNQMVVYDEQGETVKSWQKFRKHYTQPLLSHDEQYLVFMKGRYEESSSNDGQNGSGDETEKHVMLMTPDANPDSAEVITGGALTSYQPVAWSPDDRQVLVMGMTPNRDRQQDEAPNRYHILKVQRDGSGEQEITPDKVGFYYRPVSWVDPEIIGPSS